MKHYSDINRANSLERLVPDLFTYKSLLYVGARTDRIDFGEKFKEAGYDITVLEIFEDNVRYLKTVSWIKEVILGDVRKICIDKKFDVTFWWHGPEHINRDELPSIIESIARVTNNLIVLGCPWGVYEIGVIYNNPYERHITHWGYESFENLGFEVECLGSENVAGSNITSVKRLTNI